MNVRGKFGEVYFGVIAVMLLCTSIFPTSASASEQMFFKEEDSIYTKSLDIETLNDSNLVVNDSILFVVDTLSKGYRDSLKRVERKIRRELRDMEYNSFRPNPYKSIWYGLVFPGAGQIYNRRYWKLPIVYGGVVGVAYAISWNSARYTEYSRAYMDYTDSNPDTDSYLSLVPVGYPDGQIGNYVKNGLNTYRRYRDLSIIIGVAFYAITVIDAFVDAQLADFDISPDLSMKVRPKLDSQPNTLKPSVGCQMQFYF